MKMFRRGRNLAPGSGPRADAALQEIGVSRAEVARTLELSPSRVYGTLTGRGDMRVTTAQAIEAAFGVSSQYTLYNRGPIYKASIGLTSISEEAIAMGLAFERLRPDARIAFCALLRGLMGEAPSLECSV
jgi:hypothetical protein